MSYRPGSRDSWRGLRWQQAKRELIEETGYFALNAGRCCWVRYFASPGFLGEWMQIYLARDIREGEAQPELDEQIEIIRMPLSEAMKMVAGRQNSRWQDSDRALALRRRGARPDGCRRG